MKVEDSNRLDALFAAAKNQPSEIGFNEVSTKLTIAIAKGTTTYLSNKWTSKLFNLNTLLIMISTLTIIATVILTASSKDLEPTRNIETAETFFEPITINKSSNALQADIYNEEINSVNESSCDTNKTVVTKTVIKSKGFKEIKVTTISLGNETSQDILHPVNKGKKVLTEKDTVDVILNKIKFTITERTTEAELDSIKNVAEDAGLDFIYTVKVKRGHIKSLNIKMLATNTKGKKRLNQFYFRGSRSSSFSFLLKWRTDSQGKAVDFDGDGCAVIRNYRIQIVD